MLDEEALITLSMENGVPFVLAVASQGNFSGNVGISHRLDLPMTLRTFQVPIDHVVLADGMRASGLGETLNLVG